MPGKILIIAKEQSRVERLIALARSSGKQDYDLTLVLLDDAIANKTGSGNIKIKTKDDYGLTEEYLQEEGLKWYRLFPDQKVRNVRLAYPF